MHEQMINVDSRIFLFSSAYGNPKTLLKKVIYVKIRTVGAKEPAGNGRNFDPEKGGKKVIASIDLCPTKVSLSEGHP